MAGFEACDAVAQSYGYGVQPDGTITKKDGSASALKLSFKGKRVLIHASSGALMFSGSGPSSLGAFLEKFWFAKKNARDPKGAKVRTETRGALRNIAQRRVNAEERFLDYAQTHAGLTRTEAEKALQVYRKARVIRFDYVTGDFHVKHGAFLDVDTLRRAART